MVMAMGRNDLTRNALCQALEFTQRQGMKQIFTVTTCKEKRHPRSCDYVSVHGFLLMYIGEALEQNHYVAHLGELWAFKRN